MSRDHHDWVIAADHPALSGHFPGDPILPGVAILAAVLDAITLDAGDELRVIEPEA